MRSIILCSLLAVAPLTGALTQDALPLGTRVRVAAPTHFEGRKEGIIRPGALIDLSTERAGASPLVPLADVTALQRFDGWRSSWQSGALIGGLIGLLSGSALGAAACSNSTDDDYFQCTSYSGAAVVGAVGLVGGGLLGAGFGALFKHDTWKEVPLDKVKVGVRSLRDGVGLGANIVF
jgi:hypothetical protein